MAFDVATWREVLRVLKPGGHLVAFGGTRTHHRIAVAIEDAGFEIRDGLVWVYGQGFPKSRDIARDIDKIAGAKRAVVGTQAPPGYARTNVLTGDQGSETWEWPAYSKEPVTEEAARWQGWGTAIKPTWEPIILARKPFKGTVAANVLAHGTGALNVNGCRLATTDNLGGGAYAQNGTARHDGATHWRYPRDGKAGEYTPPPGRWPPNAIFSHTEECVQTGTKRVKGSLIDKPCDSDQMRSGYGGKLAGARPARGIGDADGMEEVEVWACAPGCPVAELDRQSGAGGASRFMYVAKSSTGERNAGLDVCWEVVKNRYRRVDRAAYDALPNDRRAQGNVHTTVKPLGLMRWLVRLVCPPGCVVLDPFLGSGTTAVAARLEGANVIGIDLDDVGVDGESVYLEIARRRLAHWTATA